MNKIIIGGAKVKALIDGNLAELERGYSNGNLSNIPAIKFGIESEEKLRPKGFEPLELVAFDDEKLQIRARFDGAKETESEFQIWELKTSSEFTEPLEIVKAKREYKIQISHYFLISKFLKPNLNVRVFYTVFNKNNKKPRTREIESELLREWCLDSFGTDDPQRYLEFLVRRFNEITKPRSLEIQIIDRGNKQILTPTRFRNLLNLKESIDETLDSIKEQAKEYLVANELKSTRIGEITFTLSPESTIRTLDKEQIKKDYKEQGKEPPEILSVRKSSIRITQSKEKE